MADLPFGGKAPREDLDEVFPADLVDTVGPALLGDSRPATAALVAAYLLRLAARAGGTRVRPSAVDDAIAHLERAVAPDARRWCEDEAERIARWTAATDIAEPELGGDRGVMAAADQQTRRSVVQWAISEGLDVEVEWYDEADDRWPRLRATPLGMADDDGEAAVRLKTSLAEIHVPLRDVRWLMPVKRVGGTSAPMATVLEFPSRAVAGEEE